MDPHVAGILRGGNAPKESFVPRLVPIKGWIGAHQKFGERDENSHSLAKNVCIYIYIYVGNDRMPQITWNTCADYIELSTYLPRLLNFYCVHQLVVMDMVVRDALASACTHRRLSFPWRHTKMDLSEWHDHLPTWDLLKREGSCWPNLSYYSRHQRPGLDLSKLEFSALVASWRKKSLSFTMCPEIR